MIVKLPPDQISALWDMIKFTVSESARADVLLNGSTLNNVLKNLLSGYSQCWLIYEDTERGKDIYGSVVTYINNDPMTEASTLVIYSIYGYRVAPDAIWFEGFEKLKEFARENKCDKMIGYTTSDILRDRVAFLGMKESYRVLVAEL